VKEIPPAVKSALAQARLAIANAKVKRDSERKKPRA